MGITRKQFDEIAQKYGNIGSWAVWAAQDRDGRPKSNVGDMNALNPEKNGKLLGLLKPNIVMVGLNMSGELKADLPFRNFHSPGPRANDHKLRYVFTGTEYWGAYMTDFIKNHNEVDSGKVIDYLKNHPEVINENLKAFREEMKFIGADKPLIIAIGNDVYDYLNQGLVAGLDYSRLVGIYHFASRQANDPDEYRENTLKLLDKQ